MQRFDRLRLNRPTATSSRDVRGRAPSPPPRCRRRRNHIRKQMLVGNASPDPPSTGDSIVKHLRTIAAAGFLATAILPAAAEDISGAGATFPYPIYAKWADAYKKETGVGLNYQSIGSGGGIKQIEARTVTFGATDAPLKGEELDKNGLVQFPMVMGGIVPVINLEGVSAGALVIDGPTLAKIFLGEIKTWDDPAIKKLNPNAKLPSTAIEVVH